MTVAIIGAGFSGLLTALRLLMAPDGPNVRLIERRGAFARGAAYSTLDPEHLLNVRASNMSAFPEDPDHFVRWLAQSGDPADQGLFVRRGRYGDYLQALIQTAVETAPAGRFLLEPDAAVAVDRAQGGGWRVTLAMGHAIPADVVILAIGNLPPNAPPSFAGAAAKTAAFIADPWSLGAADLPRAGEALLIGTGLSMVDVALYLSRQRPGLRMLALSRRGLLPRRHLTEGPHPLARPAPPAGVTALGLLRALRQDARDQAEWRAAFDGLRPYVHAIWRGWPVSERRRFLRHLRPWWDVHRHRLAPAVAARLDHLVAAGQLRIQAGRIRAVTPTRDGDGADALEVVWRARRETQDRPLTAAVVINCAGPSSDLEQCEDPLIRHLLTTGLVRLDPCRLGLDTDLACRLVDGEGRANETLFAVGPITRGGLWEITAVPEIRVQAGECARGVLGVG